LSFNREDAMLAAIRITDHNRNGNWVEFYEVQSESRVGVAYVVAKSRKGTWGCSCPAWIYKRGKHGDCKHIRHVLSQIESYVQPASYLKSILIPREDPEDCQPVFFDRSLIEMIAMRVGKDLNNYSGMRPNVGRMSCERSESDRSAC
jgi:hypothetical protein